METINVDIHIKERSESQPNERVFECWLDGGYNNIFTVATHQVCLTSSEVINWTVEVVRQAHAYSVAQQRDVFVNRIQELKF